MVKTKEDDQTEVDGVLTATVESGEGYLASNSSATAEVNIYDTQTLQTISLESETDSVTEGDIITLTLAASRTIQTTSVGLEFSNIEGDFIIENIQTISFSGDSTEFELATIENEFDEVDGLISVTLLPGDGYVIDNELNYVEVTIIDDEQLPEISVVTTSNQVNEGEVIELEVQSETGSNSEFSVILSIFNESGQYYDGDSILVINFAPTITSVPIEIQTLADSRFQNHGLIKIQIEEGEGYTRTSRANHYQQIKVNDENAPAGVSIRAKNAQVEIDHPTEFVVYSDVAPVQTVNLYIRKDDTGGLYDDADYHAIDFESGTFEQTIDIKDIFESFVKQVGSVRVQILASPNYTVNESNYVATTELVENTIPELSILALNSEIQAGESIKFQLRSTVESVQNVNLLVHSFPNQNSYEFNNTQIKSFEPGETELTISLPTRDHSYIQASGQIVVSIKPRPYYTVSESYSSVEFEVADDEIPIISILSQDDTISNGDPINLAVVSTIKMEEDLEINLQYTDQDNLLDNGTITSAIQIPAGSTIVNVPTIQTNTNSDSSAGGLVTIQLQNGEGYEIANEPFDQVLITIEEERQIHDGITILPVSTDYINEGETVQFLIYSPLFFNQNRTINLQVEESGQFLIGAPPSFVILNANEREAILELSTKQNNILQAQSQIKVTLLDGEHYTVADAPNNSAVVTVLDDDTVYGLSVIPLDSPILEGEVAKFQISISPTLQHDVVVWSDIVHGERVSLPVIIPKGQNNAVVEVPTLDNDEVKLEPPVIFGLIRASENIPFASSHRTAVVQVIDNDLPTLSVTSNNSIIEGEEAIFTVTSSPTPLDILKVNFEISSTGNFITGLVPSRTTLATDRGSSSVHIATYDDNLDEPNGEIKIVLLESTEYNISTEQQSATVEVADNDEVVIEIIGSYGSVQEGSNFSLVIRTELLVPAPYDIPVLLSLHGQGNFQIEDFQSHQILPAGQSIAVITIGIADDSVISAPTDLTLKLEPSTGYTISEVSSTDTVQILDNDSPSGIAILPKSHAITEGEAIPFVLTMNPPFTTSQVVQLNVIETGQFLGDTTISEIEVAPLVDSFEFAITTIDNDFRQLDGEVTVEIEANNGYNVAEIHDSATVSVLDNDHEAGLSILPVKPLVSEGGFVQFQITAASPVMDDTQVFLDVLESGNYLTSEIPGKATILAGSRSTIFSIPTVDDANYEFSGQVVVSILNSENYTVSVSPNNTASVVVLDNDQPNENSILATRDSIVEGEPAIFEISTATISHSDRIISIAIAQEGEFLQLPITNQEVILEAYQTIANVEVPTLDDDIIEANGHIMASLSIPDVDGSLHQYSSAKVTVMDNDIPIISIAPIETTVVEGSMAEFRIETAIAPIEITEINVVISQTGEFVNEVLGLKKITLLPNETTAELQISTNDDEIYDGEGSIIATLAVGDGYKIVENANEASVEILENEDLPVVSIAAETAIAQEGDLLQVVISADSKSWNDKEIAIEVTDHASNFLPLKTPTSVTLAAMKLTTSLEINTIDDAIYELAGQVSVTLQSGKGYLVSTDLPSSATINIQDNDDEPTISISSNFKSVFEGEKVPIFISSSHQSSSDIRVNLTLQSEIQNLNETRELTLNANSTSSVLEILTEYNDQQSGDHQLIIQLQKGLGYQVASEPANQSIVMVNDLEILPEISIISLSSSVSEGTIGEFRLESSRPIYSRQSISLSISRDMGNGEIVFEEAAVELNAGESSINFEIPTYQDALDWPNGQIVVSIIESEDYQASEIFSSTRIEVQDDDINSVYFANSNGTVLEGNDLLVDLKVSPAIEQAFVVNLEYEIVGDFVTANYEFQREQQILLHYFENQEFIVPIRIPTVDDNDFEASGLVAISIVEGEGYTIGKVSGATTVEFAILDNDEPEEISIVASAPEITEGDSVKFEIRAGQSTPYDRIIYFQVVDENNILPTALPEFVVINAGEKETTIDIATNDDGYYFEPSTITVSLTDGDNYELAETGRSAAVTVTDNDNYSLSISSIENITEGDEAVFTITSTQVPTENLNVAVQIELVGEFFPTKSPDFVTFPAGSNSTAVSYSNNK